MGWVQMSRSRKGDGGEDWVCLSFDALGNSHVNEEQDSVIALEVGRHGQRNVFAQCVDCHHKRA